MRLTERELQNASLMVKELASGASPQEVARLRRWIQNAPQYEQAYTRWLHKTDWEALEAQRAQIDTDKEWKALRKARRTFFMPRTARSLRARRVLGVLCLGLLLLLLTCGVLWALGQGDLLLQTFHRFFPLHG